MGTTKEGVEQFQAIVERIGGTVERLEARNAPESDIWYWKAMRDYYARALNASSAGQKLAVTGMFPPHELLLAMDIPYYVAELEGIAVAQQDAELGYKLFAAAEVYGMPTDVCSPHRAALGLSLKGMTLRPDFVVSTSTTCDQTLKLYEIIADYYGVHSFMVDNPYRFDQKGQEYARQDIRDLIAFLEEQTGEKLDYNRLKEVLRLSREAYDYWEQISELRKSVPTPLGGRGAMKDLSLTLTSIGTEAAVNYFKARYKELSEKVARKEGAIPYERYRIGWLYVLPIFDLKIADWLEQEYRAVIAFDSFTYATEGVELNPEAPIDFLAKKPLKRGFVCRGWSANELSNFAGEMAEVFQSYKSDIAIAMAHWSCQQYTGVLRLLKDEIAGKLGKPFFVLDGDLLDARVTSSDTMREKLAEFLSTLER